MHYLGPTIMLLGAAIMAFGLWGFRCSLKTIEDRAKIIRAIYGSEHLGSLGYEFDLISFERHVRARIFFQDPFALYSTRIQELMK